MGSRKVVGRLRLGTGSSGSNTSTGGPMFIVLKKSTEVERKPAILARSASKGNRGRSADVAHFPRLRFGLVCSRTRVPSLFHLLARSASKGNRGRSADVAHFPRLRFGLVS